MKICWDMLEGARLMKSGTFRKGGVIYIYKETCVKCGDPYLAEKRRNTKFCSISCSSKDRGHSIEARKKISKANVDKVISYVKLVINLYISNMDVDILIYNVNRGNYKWNQH